MADLESLLADTRYWLDQGSDPAAPSAGEPVTYTKSGQLYVRNSTGIVGPLLDETAHDSLDHTGLTGVGGGGATGGATGNVLMAAPAGMDIMATGNTGTAGSDVAFAIPINIPGSMQLRGLVFNVSAAAAGSIEWGLFDYSSTPAACTKLAGGSGALGSTGWQSIAATTAPVSISAGNYMLIWKSPSSNVPTLTRVSTAPANADSWIKNQTSYAWSNTPDITSGWADLNIAFITYLKGDYDASGGQW